MKKNLFLLALILLPIKSIASTTEPGLLNNLLRALSKNDQSYIQATLNRCHDITTIRLAKKALHERILHKKELNNKAFDEGLKSVPDCPSRNQMIASLAMDKYRAILKIDECYEYTAALFEQAQIRILEQRPTT